MAISPPVGLRPRYLAKAERVNEILQAITRYSEAERHVPDDWIDELRDLTREAPRAETVDGKVLGRVEVWYDDPIERVVEKVQRALELTSVRMEHKTEDEVDREGCMVFNIVEVDVCH